MNQSKTILISTLAASLLVLAGCTTQTSTNTNTIKDNANVKMVTNTNETVDNENTNTSDEVLRSPEDVADWLTYTNEEISLSFQYPNDWKIDRNDNEDSIVEVLDNNDMYNHQLVNLYVMWSDRHEDVTYESGVTNPSFDRWLNCDYIYDIQASCSKVIIDGIEVTKREGEIEPPFGDDYVALAYKQNDFTVVIDARSLLRESANEIGNSNLDGLKYINAVIETISINQQ